MGQTMLLTEQGEENYGFLGALNEEDQKRYDSQSNKEKEDSTMRLNNPGEPTKN